MKKLRTIALLMIVSLMLVSCGGSSESTTPAVPEQEVSSGGSSDPASPEDLTITVGISKLPTSFNITEYGTSIQMQLVFEGLFRYNPKTNEIENHLAEDWEYLDDLTLRIKIKDGVYFSNGEKLTAEDVLFSFANMANPANNSPQSNSYNMYDFENSYAEDELTVILKTFEPYGPGIGNLARYPDIHSKSFYENITDPATLWDTACGSGPYTIVENISGSHAVLKLRDDYWDKDNMPEVDTFIIRGYSEISTMFIDFENGDLDLILTLDDSSYQRLLRGEVPGTTVKASGQYDLYYIVLPEYVEAFDDIRVREAFVTAVDWQTVGEITLGSLASLPTSNLASAVVPFYEEQGAYEYNPEKARQILAEAGYSEGDIVINALCSNLAVDMRVFESIQGYLAEVGIIMQFEAFESSAVMPRIAGGETDLFLLAPFAGTPIPEPSITMQHAHGKAFMAPCVISDVEYNSYWDLGNYSIDQDTRIKAYKDAQRWLHENYRHVPIIESKTAFAFYDDVIADFNTNVDFNPSLLFLDVK